MREPANNGFLTTALGLQWPLWRTLSPCDKLLISVGASHFCLQWVVISVLLYSKPFLSNPLLFLAFSGTSLWFSSWLSVFYHMEIATIPHPVFLWLKQKMSGLVPWMLLSSVGLSSLSTMLFLIGHQSLYQDYLRRGLQSWNVTGNTVRRTVEKFDVFPLNVVPTVVFLTGMVVLITSLGRYVKKTFLSTSSHGLSAQARVKALLALVSFAILFTSAFLSLGLSAAGVFPPQELKWKVMTYLCTVVHPIVLLVSTPG
ncbi:LOW QUALITY PROTEIN: taste receptor type 2 member 60 [Molossus nigricans]